eukprot:633239_1
MELSKENEVINRVANDLGFVIDESGSDDCWLRFVMSTHVPVNTEFDQNSHDTGVAIGNVPKMEPPIDLTNASSIRERIRKFSCESCDKTFTLKNNLKRHISDVHDYIRKFKCDSCDKNFSRKSTLKQHVNEVHEQIRKFSCDSCDQSFS